MHPQYHPIIILPAEYEVYDFSQGYDAQRVLQHPYGVGKYNEHRPSMYTSALFTENNMRDIHIGVDIGCPIRTPVYAFTEGTIAYQGYNSAELDYGHVIITKHTLGESTYWVLHGHLSADSIQKRAIGEHFIQGEILGYVGDTTENGGWNPHIHIQISTEDPKTHDMPGVVSSTDRNIAIQKYPDPSMILGKLY